MIKKTGADLDCQDEIVLTGRGLTIEDVVTVARERARVAPLSPSRRALESRQWVEKVIDKEILENGGPLTVYGINTPFGSLAFKNVFKTPKEAQKLSRNIITSHAAGVGRYASEDVVRATMLIRANTLAKGFSGIRPQVIDSLIQALNADIYPAVPEKGPVGASGDLAPLSHIALLISKPPTGIDSEEESGEVLIPFAPEVHDPSDCVVVEGAVGQKTLKVKTWAKSVMEQNGVSRWILEAKEGLALNNGATFSAAMAALAVHDADLLVKNAEIALAMTIEAVESYRDPFLPQVHRARGHQGQIDCALSVLDLVKGSSLVDGDESVNPKVHPPHDAYSIRCAPQVIGAVREVLSWARGVVETELNAATDDPLIFASKDASDAYYLPRTYKAISCGNFHGELLAFAMDFLGIAVAELGNIAERRIFRLLTGHLNRDLESMLVRTPEAERGLHSGFMIAQFTAAALVSDNKTLAHPDSVDSVPTCEDLEDHVSMSPNAARHAREIIWNVGQIIGIEMLCAAQALDLRLALEYDEGYDQDIKNKERKKRLGKGTKAAHDYIRDKERGRIRHWGQDRIMYPDLARAGLMVSSGEIARAVEAVFCPTPYEPRN